MNTMCIDKYITRIYGVSMSDLKQYICNIYIYVLGEPDDYDNIKYTNFYDYIEIYDVTGNLPLIIELYQLKPCSASAIKGARIYCNRNKEDKIREGVLRVFLKMFYKETEKIKIRKNVCIDRHYTEYMVNTDLIYKAMVDSPGINIVRKHPTELLKEERPTNFKSDTPDYKSSFNNVYAVQLCRLFLILVNCTDAWFYDHVVLLNFEDNTTTI